jgi:CRISPR-associated protein Cmr1
MTTNFLEIKLSTVTPIWTGGADGRSDRLHITGTMGSLRWWYEVMVRGLGGWACDPGENSCSYNKEKANDGLCDVCRVFGATGWARRFRLIVTDETQLQPERSPRLQISASRSYKNRSGQMKTPTRYFKSAPLRGHVNIKLIRTDQQFQIEVIAGLIQFLADWATIGAKPQMGFGIVDITTRQELQPLMEHLQVITGSSAYDRLPSLRNIFFASIQAKNSPLEETFNLKYDLRRLFARNDNLRHFVMGEAPQEGDRQGAKIMMSRPYNGTIRLWGWIPEEVSQFHTSRAQVIKQIHSHLSTKYSINYWREFNSIRDTVQQGYANPQEFLNSLLKGEGR